jgi:glycosyltransferase involved in cell wall biosynthesis
MRILHVLTAFPRSADDVIVPWLVELLKHLRAAGHDVEVLTSAYRGGGNREFAGIPVHRFRYFPARWENLTHDEAAPDRLRRSLPARTMPAFYVLGGLLAAWRLGRRRPPYDVVHVHWPVPHALFGWAIRRSSGGRTRMVTTWYGAELRWVKGSLPWLRQFVAWALGTSDQVVAISGHTAAEIRAFRPVEPRVIPYTVGFGTPEPGEASARRENGFVILFVGRLVERKGVRVLIEALRELPRGLRARLVVIGDGPERAALEAQARQDGVAAQVEFRGRVTGDDLKRAYAGSNAFVLPAVVDARGDTEGLGVVLLEAMSYGVPVIGSDVGGITDIVTSGESGLLVPPGNPAALAAAIQRLATDPVFASRLGQAGQRRVREDFSWPAIVRRWEECYAAAVSRNR